MILHKIETLSLITETVNGITYIGHTVHEINPPSNIYDGLYAEEGGLNMFSTCVAVGGTKSGYDSLFIGMVFPEMKLVREFILYGFSNISTDASQKYWIVGFSNETNFNKNKMIVIGMYSPLAMGLNSGLANDFPLPMKSVWMSRKENQLDVSAI